MPAPFRNLVFEGGGMKGIAHVGVLQVLENRGILPGIRRVGGASAGAIHALLLTLGYTPQEQQEILLSTEFRHFLDRSFGVIRDLRRLARNFGYHRGEVFRGWLGALVKERLGDPEATFADLESVGAPDPYVIGTNLSTGFAEVFSHERHPTMPLVEAVRISMSIPLFFQAVRHGPRNDVYVDGGMQLNYPVKLFDRIRYVEPDEAQGIRYTEYYDRENARFALLRPGRSPYIYNRQTLGVRLDTTAEIGLFRYDEPLVGTPIRSFTDYARALFRGVMHVQSHVHLHSDDWQRTVYVDTLEVGTTDFRLPRERQLALVEQGILGAERYFRWFDDPAEHPVNRVDDAPPIPAPSAPSAPPEPPSPEDPA
jgi:NTE family protein